MVGTLIRLSLQLQKNQLTRSVSAVIALVLLGLYALGALVFAIGALFGLGFVEDPELRFSILALLGSALVLLWALVTPLFVGVDQTLDPRRFATLLVPRRELVTGLLLAGAINPLGIATLLVGLLWGAASARSFAGLLLGSVGGLLGALLSLALARLTSTALSALLQSRLFRESSMLAGFLGLMFLGPVIGVGGFVAQSPELRSGIGGVLAWTPIGAPWVVGADALAGSWGAALARLGIALASLLIVLWVWGRALERELAEAGAPAKESRTRSSSSTSGVIGRLGRGPLGAMTARSLVYWVKDPRYSFSLVAIPLVIGMMVFQSATVGGPAGLFMMFLLGFLTAWGLAMDTSYDSTAHWIFVAAGVRGRDERLARVLSYAVIGGATMLLAGVVQGVARHSAAEGALTALFGVGVWCIAAGAGVLLSSFFVQETVRPNESVFTTRSGGPVAVAIQFGGLAGIALLSLAPGLLIGIGLGTDRPLMAWGGAGLGLLIGGIVLAVGLNRAGVLYDRRQAYLLEQLVRFDHS
ncbi:hypothetical protein [Arthrobacter sp. UM1]|uniref:hypothetical protein n=1 Tax=Arthrobacter sp. UM1 TaxID=2766776 RepID=UPI001CF6FD38|nr:hypothetical protein [Arthrobacter sp. UM1]MCB4207248.1 hypothetical protein [Arthrobacter sp. UM1]